MPFVDGRRPVVVIAGVTRDRSEAGDGGDRQRIRIDERERPGAPRRHQHPVQRRRVAEIIEADPGFAARQRHPLCAGRRRAGGDHEGEADAAEAGATEERSGHGGYDSAANEEERSDRADSVRVPLRRAVDRTASGGVRLSPVRFDGRRGGGPGRAGGRARSRRFREDGPGPIPGRAHRDLQRGRPPRLRAGAGRTELHSSRRGARRDAASPGGHRPLAEDGASRRHPARRHRSQRGHRDRRVAPDGERRARRRRDRDGDRLARLEAADLSPERRRLHLARAQRGSLRRADRRGPTSLAVRPVAEAVVEHEFGVASLVSGLVGAIWRARKALSFDVAVRLAREVGANSVELRAGLTWDTALWGS